MVDVQDRTLTVQPDDPQISTSHAFPMVDVQDRTLTVQSDDPPISTESVRVCQFCFKSGENKSRTFILSTSTVHKFLDFKAVPTPFLYEYLSKLRQKLECFFVCSNCDSWTRRNYSAKNAKKCDKKILLAVDRLILCIMLPGTYTPPEMRITSRLIQTIRKNNGVNWLASICPPLVVKALCENDICMESRKVLKSISVAAWRSGRRQAILGNATFAKNVRCAKHIV
jgi:hypothetical protein